MAKEHDLSVLRLRQNDDPVPSSLGLPGSVLQEEPPPLNQSCDAVLAMAENCDEIMFMEEVVDGMFHCFTYLISINKHPLSPFLTNCYRALTHRPTIGISNLVTQARATTNPL